MGKGSRERARRRKARFLMGRPAVKRSLISGIDPHDPNFAPLPVTCPICALTFDSTVDVNIGPGVTVERFEVGGDLWDPCPRCNSKVPLAGEWHLLRESVRDVVTLGRNEIAIVRSALEGVVTSDDVAVATRVIDGWRDRKALAALLRSAATNPTSLAWIAIAISAAGLAYDTISDDASQRLTPEQVEQIISRVLDTVDLDKPGEE